MKVFINPFSHKNRNWDTKRKTSQVTEMATYFHHKWWTDWMDEWWKVASCMLQWSFITSDRFEFSLFFFFLFHLNILRILKFVFDAFTIHYSEFDIRAYHCLYHLLDDFEFKSIYLSFEYRDISSGKADPCYT